MYEIFANCVFVQLHNCTNSFGLPLFNTDTHKMAHKKNSWMQKFQSIQTVLVDFKWKFLLYYVWLLSNDLSICECVFAKRARVIFYITYRPTTKKDFASKKKNVEGNQIFFSTPCVDVPFFFCLFFPLLCIQFVSHIRNDVGIGTQHIVKIISNKILFNAIKHHAFQFIFSFNENHSCTDRRSLKMKTKKNRRAHNSGPIELAKQTRSNVNFIMNCRAAYHHHTILFNWNAKRTTTTAMLTPAKYGLIIFATVFPIPAMLHTVCKLIWPLIE